MKFRVIAVGKAPGGALGEAIAAFEARAARYWPLQVVELRGEPARSRPPAEVRRRETARVMERAVGHLVLLDERGRRFSSEAFAAWMQSHRERAEDVAFAIGGAGGFDPEARDRAAMLLSLAPWTLSHDLARLVLAEQLYRAGSIVRGEPYHRA